MVFLYLIQLWTVFHIVSKCLDWSLLDQLWTVFACKLNSWLDLQKVWKKYWINFEVEKLAPKTCAKNAQKYFLNWKLHNKIVQKNACKPKKVTQLGKISTDSFCISVRVVTKRMFNTRKFHRPMDGFKLAPGRREVCKNNLQNFV